MHRIVVWRLRSSNASDSLTYERAFDESEHRTPLIALFQSANSIHERLQVQVQFRYRYRYNTRSI